MKAKITPMSLTPNTVANLKTEIEYVIGRKILTSKDCIDLSDAIFKRTGFSINANTLRRFFGLVKSQYPASVTTLNILAAYCGASSLEDLDNYRTEREGEQKEQESTILLRYLTGLFQNVVVANVNDTTFIRLTHNTIEFLNQNPEIACQFQKAVVKTVNGRRFYFEQFVNIDKLNTFYGSGLRYYLAENKSVEAQLFGHSVLCFRYWLTMDFERLDYHYKQLSNYNVSDEINLLTCARYFAARLFYAEATGGDMSYVIWEANEFYINIKASNMYNNSFPGFELVFSEALILTGNYSDALIYTTEGSRRASLTHHSYIDVELFKGFKLYHAIVLYGLGNEKKAVEIFESINPIDFYFITRQFHTVLYITLGTKLNKIRSGREQLNILVQETGFKKLMQSQKVMQ